MKYYSITEVAEKLKESYQVIYDLVHRKNHNGMHIPIKVLLIGKRQYCTVNGQWVLSELKKRHIDSKEKVLHLQKQIEITEGEINSWQGN